jgi:hypothetical protein
MKATPRLLRVQTGATSADLYSLLSALDSQTPHHCEALQVQLDPEAGSVYLLIGNSDVDATHWGAKLVAGQAYQIPPTSGNLILLNQVFIIMSDASVQGVGVSVTTR